MVHKSELNITRKQAEQALQLVNKRYKLASYKEIDHGIINLIYFLKNQHGNEFVLRICNPLWESFKVRKEKAVYDLVRKKINIPIPNILVADTSKKVLPYTFTIWKKIEGENLGKVFGTLSQKQKIKIFRKLADFLIQLHRIHFKKFGDFDKENGKIKITAVGDIYCSCPRDICDPGPFKSWKTMYQSLINMDLNGLKKTKFKRYIPKFRKFFKKYLKLWSKKVPPCFLHLDYALSNFLVRNTKIVAVLDFEWALTGDNEYEFSAFEKRYANKYPAPFNHFKRIYTKTFPLSEEYEKKKVIYHASDLTGGMISFEWSHKKLSKEKKLKKYKELCEKIDTFLENNT